MTSPSEQLRNLLKNSPDECIKWALRWNNIRSKIIPKGKRQKVFHDLQLLNMGYDIRYDKDKSKTLNY